MADGSSPFRMTLARSLNTHQASELADALASRRGAALALDASGVEHVGGLCLQLLAAAAATWRQDGHDFAVIEASEAFARDLALLGNPIDMPNEEGGGA